MESRKSHRKSIRKRRRSIYQRHGSFPEPTTQRKSTVIITNLRRFFKRQKRAARIARIIVITAAVGAIIVELRAVPGIIRASRSEPVQQSEVLHIQETEPAAVQETETTEAPACRWTTDEGYIMAKMAMAEAEDQDTEGKALVILVILNRVEDEHFPDTIEDVISQRNAFSSYSNGRYDRVEPDEDCSAALSLVESGWDESQGATFFEADATDETWHAKHLRTLFTHGAHTFYKEEDNEP